MDRSEISASGTGTFFILSHVVEKLWHFDHVKCQSNFPNGSLWESRPVLKLFRYFFRTRGQRSNANILLYSVLTTCSFNINIRDKQSMFWPLTLRRNFTCKLEVRGQGHFSLLKIFSWSYWFKNGIVSWPTAFGLKVTQLQTSSTSSNWCSLDKHSWAHLRRAPLRSSGMEFLRNFLLQLV